MISRMTNSRKPAIGWRRGSTRRLTAALTLIAQVGTTVAPAYAYADTDASSGSLADFSRVDGGGFSTVGNRPSATTGEAPAAVTSGDTEPTDEPNATGSVKIAAGGERETGEALGEGAEGDSSIADQE